MLLINSRTCILIIRPDQMKLLGFVLLLSGWGIVVAALALLHGAVLPTFVVAGVATEILGFVFVARAHIPSKEGSE